MDLPPAPFNQRTLAERWGCDPTVVARMCRTGKIRHFKGGARDLLRPRRCRG
jgi:hypothetical protein